MEINKEKISRIEVISKKGREYVNDDCKISILELQDDKKTLKIFIE